MQSNNSINTTDTGSFKISTRTEESQKIGAVVCPECSHKFIKLTDTGILSNAPLDLVAELKQGAVTALTGYGMYHVTANLVLLSSSLATFQLAIQTTILIITIFLLWLSLPVLQYMRLYSTWLWCVYALNAVFVPLSLFIALLKFFGGAS